MRFSAKDIRQDVRDKRKAFRKQRAFKKRDLHSRRAKRNRVIIRVVAVAIMLLLCLLFAFMVGDSNYHATITGWTPLFMVATAILIAFIYIQVLKRSLTITETPASLDCCRDEEIHFTACFKNTSPLFFFRVKAFFFVSDLYGNIAKETPVVLSLAPFEEMEIDFDVAFEHIGNYTAGVERVVVHDFLGLFYSVVENNTKRHVNVTPKIQMVDGIRFSNDALLESQKAAKTVIADSMDYSHVREYVQGDPLKTVHWKLSARTGTYMTRLYEMHTNPGVGIIMDFYAPAEDADTLMCMYDAVVECALSIGTYSRECGMETELFFCDKTKTNRRVATWTAEDFPDLIEDMPKMSNSESDKYAGMNILRDQIMSSNSQNNLVVCSGSLEPQLISTVVEAKLQRRHPMMIAVVPQGLSGRALDAYVKNLAPLDGADIPYMIVSRSENLLEGGLG